MSKIEPHQISSCAMTFTIDRATELLDQWFAPWVKALGLQFESIAPSGVVARMPENKAVVRVDGIVSGQATMAAIDTVMVFAVFAHLGKEVVTSTVSQTTNFLRPIREGDAMIEVVVHKSGRTLAFGNALVYMDGDRERPVATATITCAILRP